MRGDTDRKPVAPKHRAHWRALANAHDAEDAFQATFLLLMQKAGSLRLQGSVSSWLYGVACRLARRATADAARRRVHESRAPARSLPDTVTELTLREAQAADWITDRDIDLTIRRGFARPDLHEGNNPGLATKFKRKLKKVLGRPS